VAGSVQHGNDDGKCNDHGNSGYSICGGFR
jgi:hypothetical protein